MMQFTLNTPLCVGIAYTLIYRRITILIKVITGFMSVAGVLSTVECCVRSVRRKEKAMNKEAAIKRMHKIFLEWVNGPSLKFPYNIVVDAVIGEMFGWKAENGEECYKCNFCIPDWEWGEYICVLSDNGWKSGLDDLWLTCPKPEKPGGADK
jgi:hypothetical protein